MPTFDEAKACLKALYIDQGYRLIDEHARDLYFAIGTAGTLTFIIQEEDISEYQSVADELSSYRLGAFDTAIAGPGYCEQLVDVIGASRALAFSVARQKAIQFSLHNESNAPHVEIGPCSPVFKNFFRFRKEQASFFRDRTIRIFASLGRQTSSKSEVIREVFQKIFTIRIRGPNLPINQLGNITATFESRLFDLSYLSNTHIQLRNEWPALLTDRRRQRPSGARSSLREPIPIKRIIYDTPSVRFYQRAVGTDDAYIQFISFYHVLEYYFVSVADSVLYAKIFRLLADPAFRPVDRHMDKLIMAVEDHKRSNDETEMLKGVLSAYMTESDLIDFIVNYETRENVKIYTEKSECFGEELDKMQLKENHVFGAVSKRIKTIRNTLIHSSDRYERKQRYLPGPDADRVLARELPLLKYVAERVIIATAHASD